MKGKVMTVLGTVDPEVLGPTLPHEHLLIDVACWFMEPEEASLSKMPICYYPLQVVLSNSFKQEELDLM